MTDYVLRIPKVVKMRMTDSLPKGCEIKPKMRMTDSLPKGCEVKKPENGDAQAKTENGEEKKEERLAKAERELRDWQGKNEKPQNRKKREGAAWIAFEGEGADCKVAWGGEWDQAVLEKEKEEMEK